MTQLTRHRSLDAPPEAVWSVMTDPDVYAAVAPNLSTVEILEGEGEGMVRRCTDTDGNEWTETCHDWTAGRGFAVTVDVERSDFHRPLFSRFEGEWRLTPLADGTRVTMRFDFDTRYGPLGWLVGRYLAFRAPPLMEAIFDGWETEIAARLAADDASSGTGATDGPRPNQLYR